MSFFGKNIRKIRSVKSLSQQSFAEIFDLKRGTLGAYEEGRSEPKLETIVKIAKYFSIPIDDLLTKELTVNKLLKFKGNLSTDHTELVREQFASVPCILQSQYQDYTLNYNKREFIENMPCLRLPISKQISYRAYTVGSLEMSSGDKGLFPKDVVIGENIPKSSCKKLNNGILAVVLFENQLVLRRLYITNDIVVLRADHKIVEDIEVKLKDVKELWRVNYVFYHRIPETGDGVEEKLLKIEQEMEKLRRRVE